MSLEVNGDGDGNGSAEAPEPVSDIGAARQHRRYEVYKLFFTTTRMVIDQIIDDEMEEHDKEVVLREERVMSKEKGLQERLQELEAYATRLVEREDAVVGAEMALLERERRVIARERAAEAEWAKIRQARAGLTSLPNKPGDDEFFISID